MFLLYGGLFFLNPATPQWLKVSAGPHYSAVRSGPTDWCHQDGLRLPQELLAALLLIVNILVIAFFVCECSACILAVAAVRCAPACLQIPDLPLPPPVKIIEELLLSIIWHIDEHSNRTFCVLLYGLKAGPCPKPPPYGAAAISSTVEAPFRLFMALRRRWQA